MFSLKAQNQSYALEKQTNKKQKPTNQQTNKQTNKKQKQTNKQTNKSTRKIF